MPPLSLKAPLSFSDAVVFSAVSLSIGTTFGVEQAADVAEGFLAKGAASPLRGVFLAAGGAGLDLEASVFDFLLLERAC